MDAPTEAIAGFAAGLTFERVPAPAVRTAKQHLIDTLACALGGRDCDAAAMARRLAEGAAPARLPGYVVGSAAPVGAEAAAFANTAMIRYLDFNDTVYGGHPSDCLGGVLALAAAAGAGGKRLLASMVVGYEVALRLIAATKLRERGWDQGFFVAIAAAAAVGNLLRLGAGEIAHAVAIATVANLPLRATRAGELSRWKGAATAFACRNGVYAALLAAEGMTGPEAAFAGRHGVFEQVTGGPFALVPFDEFLTPRAGLKFWPVENSAQAGVWAALELRRTMAVEAVASIAIATNWATWHEIGSEPAKWDPRTRETADHSLPYIFARALVGGTIGVASFAPDSYLDPALRPLMAKIAIARDDAIERLFPARTVMRVRAADRAGAVREIEIADPRGHPLNPMSEEETAAKFRNLAEPALGASAAAAFLARLSRIEEERDAGAVLALARGAA